MTNTSHLLEVYDMEDYAGPNPIRVVGIGMVRGPENRQYYVLETAEPVNCDQNSAKQLAVLPHYQGDCCSKILSSVCTVSIALAKPGQTFVPDEKYGFSDFCFWKVGKIHPLNASVED
jgi:hypothetical protein